jgi:hypothetical protein
MPTMEISRTVTSTDLFSEAETECQKEAIHKLGNKAVLVSNHVAAKHVVDDRGQKIGTSYTITTTWEVPQSKPLPLAPGHGQ